MITDTAAARLRRVQANLVRDGFDAMVVVKPQNAYYLSGYTPVIHSHPALVFLPAQGNPAFIPHALRAAGARAGSWLTDIRPYGRWSTVAGQEHWWEVLADLAAEHGVHAGRIGVEGEFLPVNLQQRIAAALPSARLADSGAAVLRARFVKDDKELSALRDACRIADTGMAAALEAVAARGSEVEVASAAMTAMQHDWRTRFPHRTVVDFGSLEGGVFNALWAYSLVGDRVALNSAPPTTRRPVAGELQWTVVWVAVDGMHAENERTVAIGRIDDERRRAFEAVLAIRDEVLPHLRPGVSCAEVYEVARRGYLRRGYGDHLPGRVGHGLGLGPHEPPSLGPGDDTVLEAGMTVTIEPNLRIPAFGGLQHSDSVLITEGGPELLTTTRRDLIQV